MRFAISTLLFSEQKLTKEILQAIKAAGFDEVELFCYTSHFNYKDPNEVRSIVDTLNWLRLTVNSLHSPLFTGPTDQSDRKLFSVSDADAAARRETLQEFESALAIADHLPVRYLVVHMGRSREKKTEELIERSKESLRQLTEQTDKRHVTIALENIPNEPSSISELVNFLDENGFDNVRTCLDTGHAFLAGELPQRIHLLKGRLVTTHIHDNLGTEDDHLLPFEGKIKWEEVVSEMKKINYTGAYLLELDGRGDPMRVLRNASQVVERLGQLA